MSGWRHEEEADDGRCRVDVEGLPCGCYPPTPDQASPCGWMLVDEDLLGVESPCGWHETYRCRCGATLKRRA